MSNNIIYGYLTIDNKEAFRQLRPIFDTNVSLYGLKPSVFFNAPIVDRSIFDAAMSYKISIVHNYQTMLFEETKGNLEPTREDIFNFNSFGIDHPELIPFYLC